MSQLESLHNSQSISSFNENEYDDIPELIEDSSSDEENNYLNTSNYRNHDDEYDSELEKKCHDVHLNVTHLRERCHALKIKFDSPTETKCRKTKEKIEYLKKQRSILNQKVRVFYEKDIHYQTDKETKERIEIELNEKREFESIKENFLKEHPINILIEKEKKERKDIQIEEMDFYHDLYQIFVQERPIGLICSSSILTEIYTKNESEENEETVIPCRCLKGKKYILFIDEYITMECTQGCQFVWHRNCYKKWILQNYEENIENFNEEGHLDCFTPECEGVFSKNETWHKEILQSSHEYKENKHKKIIIHREKKVNTKKDSKKIISKREKNKTTTTTISVIQFITTNSVNNNKEEKKFHNNNNNNNIDSNDNKNNTFVCSLPEYKCRFVPNKPTSSVSLWDFVNQKIIKKKDFSNSISEQN